MAHELIYRVENATIGTVSTQTTFQGESASVLVERAIIEAVPVDHPGGTLSLALPPSAIADFAEGSEITVTISPKED